MPHRFSPRSTRAVRLPLHPRPRRRRRRLSENDLVETLMTTYDVDWDMAHGVLSYLGPESMFVDRALRILDELLCISDD